MPKAERRSRRVSVCMKPIDRVVVGLPPDSSFSSEQSGSTLTVHLHGIGQVSQPGKTGRRVLGMDGGDGELSIRMAAGTHAHIFRVGDRLVIDVAGWRGTGTDGRSRREPACTCQGCG